mmetsp:Transcript_12979/g.19391  ORF Transcript_12979/g.19391 Transcript_12979/m.19391 type:complete len:232 (-) Transcript_12979:63-758(-)
MNLSGNKKKVLSKLLALLNAFLAFSYHTPKSFTSTLKTTLKNSNFEKDIECHLRRNFIEKCAFSLAVGSTLAVFNPMVVYANDYTYLPEGSPKRAVSWYPLIKQQYSALNELLVNWDKIVPVGSSDGDAIRRKIGTVGVSSPLSAIKKTFSGIRDSTDVPDDVELVEFVEAYQAVLTDLSDAENDLYSANFAEFSGGGHLKGYNFILKAKKSLQSAKSNFDLVMESLDLLQ